MADLLLTLYFHYFLILRLLAVDQTSLPRMTFTQKELTLESVNLPEEIRTFLLLKRDDDPLMAVGERNLISFDFQNPNKTVVGRQIRWPECPDPQASPHGCDYDVVLAHQREDGARVFVCGTDGTQMLCCDMTLSDIPLTCRPTDDLVKFKWNSRSFNLKGDKPSVLVESKESSSLFVTYSGSLEHVGVRKFGKKRVGPAYHDKEQDYVGVVLSRHKDDSLQDKVYAFYKERNKDLNVCNSGWLPYISQFCVVDMGGPKNNMQFTWTSQMSAKLFCGDPASKKNFLEMVDITTVQAEQWQDTLVYALFRNEWNMSAVCVYSIKDIQDVFTNSSFRGSDPQGGRPRECVPDSRVLPLAVLRMIEKNSEMEQWVKPVNNSGPLLVSHHPYTRVRADAAFAEEYTLLFLSRNGGGVDKVVLKSNTAFNIAEYRPFANRAHINDIIFNPFSKNLYVKSGNQLVRMNVADCRLYGDNCEQCVLARDPHCGWDGDSCAPVPTNSDEVIQDVKSGNFRLCSSSPHVNSSQVVSRPITPEVALPLPRGFQFFLPCPTGSHHAHYTWRHNDSKAKSCAWSPHGCLLFIDGEQEGAYTCTSEEQGYSRVLARYAVKVAGGATLATGHTGMLILLAALVCIIM
ncbi:semaphorin-7A-like isoform X1 [Stigmatopora argus]